MGLRPDETVSPKVLRKMVWAGAHHRSFTKAANGVDELAELDISGPRVRRATVKIGDERVAQRNADVERFKALPLPDRRKSPVAVTPQAVAIEMDGGRMQYRDRHTPEEADEVVVESGRKGRFWRETKVGLLLTLASQTFTEDPCPTIPEVFVDPHRFPKICQEIKGTTTTGAPAAKPSEEKTPARPGQPEPLVRSVVATRQKLEPFGWLLVTAAWQRGFLAAQRKAFLGDGLEQNWTIWQRHFSDFVAILDLLHGLGYVYAAALAGRNFAAGWPIYCQWAQWVWSGQVELVIAALRERQTELGLPTEEDGETSPRQVVADGLRYLENQKARMKYDEYRRQGLPLTTSYGESVIKQINLRVKGTEQFWSEGGEALLQLSADYLSDTQPLATFWTAREKAATGQRHYETAV